MIVAALFASLLSTSAFAPSPDLALYVREQARVAGVPASLAESVMQIESGGNVLATHENPDGTFDRGPWQLNDDSLPWLEKHLNGGEAINPYDQYESTRIAVRYLAYLRKRTGSWGGAVMAYNAGSWAVRVGAVPVATKEYAANVFALAAM